MNQPDTQIARRAVVIMLILTLANLGSSFTALFTVHRLEATINAQVAAAARAASASDTAAAAAKQTASAVQVTAQTAKQAATTINQAAQTLCASSRMDCKDAPKPPLLDAPVTTPTP